MFVTKLLSTLLLFTSLASACGGDSFRCKHHGSMGADHAETKRICDILKESTCACVHHSEEYCDTKPGDNENHFKELCLANGEGWYWKKC